MTHTCFTSWDIREVERGRAVSVSRNWYAFGKPISCIFRLPARLPVAYAILVYTSCTEGTERGNALSERRAPNFVGGVKGEELCA